MRKKKHSMDYMHVTTKNIEFMADFCCTILQKSQQ